MHFRLEEQYGDSLDCVSLEDAAEYAARDFTTTAEFELYVVRPCTPEEVEEFNAALVVARAKKQERQDMFAECRKLERARDKVLAEHAANRPPEIVELDTRIAELRDKLKE